MSGSAIDLGTIYTTIRIALEPLQQDVRDAVGVLGDVQTRVDEVATQVKASLTNAFSGLDGPAKAALGRVTTDAQSAAAALGEVGTAGARAGEEAAAGAEKAAAGLRGTGAAAEEGGSGVQGFLGHVLGIGAAIGGVELAASAFEMVRDKVMEAAQAGMQANQVAAQTVAGLRSTHDASGMTADSIDALSTHIMQMTGIDDDAVHSAENMLLTFTNIGRSVFPQATQAVADLATKMAGGAVPSAIQMQQASIQLGKALGDPLKGYTALQRVGVTFSEQQKEQIKNFMASGNVAGAQNVILKEMNKEFGGSAQAAGQANGGIAILRAEMENTTQTIGQALVPVIDTLTNALMPLAQWAGQVIPQAIQFLTQHADEAKIVLAGVGIIIGSVLLPALGALLGPLFAAEGAIGGLIGGLGAISLPVVAVAAALVGLVLLLRHAYETSAPFRQAIDALKATLTEFAAIVQFQAGQALAAILPHLEAAAQWVGGALTQAFNTLVPWLVQGAQWLAQVANTLDGRLGPASDAAGASFQRFGDWVQNSAVPAIRDLTQWLSDHLGPVLRQAADWTQNTLLPALQRFGDWVMTTALPAIEGFAQRLETRLGPILQQIGQWVQTGLLPALAQFGGWVMTTAIPAVQQLAGWLHDHLGPGFTDLQTTVQTVWNVLAPIWQALQAQVQPILDQLSTTLHESLIPAWESLKGSFDQIKPPITDLITLIGEQLGPTWTALQPILKVVGAILGVVLITAIGALVGALTGLIAWLGQVIQGAIKFAGGIIEAIGGALEIVTSIVSGFFTVLFDIFHGNWGKIGGDLAKAWAGISDGLQKVVGGIWTAIQGLFQVGITATLALLQGFVNGFAGAIDAIAKALGFKGNLIPLWAPPGAGGSAGAAGTSGGTTGHGRAAAAYARGTANHPGGLALVGEEGPEVVNLPKGAAVLPAGPSAKLLSWLGIPGYAGGIGDFVGGLLAHLGDGAAALIQQGLSAAGVTTKALTGVLGDLGSGTLSELMKLATTAIAHLLKTVTSTQNGGGGPVSASSGSAPGLLPGFPLMNQLAQHDVNDTNDCVPTSMASAASFLLKRLVSPVGIKDDVYGSGYVGGQAPDRYKGEMGKLGVTLQDAYGSAQSLIATIISHLRAGQPVLGSIPSDWNVISQGGPTHEVAFAGYDAGKGLLTAMNPWRGFFQTASPAWWAPRLQYGTVNPLVKLANGGVLREAVAGLGLSSGRSYLMGEAGPEAVTPLSQVGNGGVNIEHLEVTVVAAAEDGQPYAAGMAFGNGFAAGFQQARTQRGL